MKISLIKKFISFAILITPFLSHAKLNYFTIDSSANQTKFLIAGENRKIHMKMVGLYNLMPNQNARVCKKAKHIFEGPSMALSTESLKAYVEKKSVLAIDVLGSDRNKVCNYSLERSWAFFSLERMDGKTIASSEQILNSSGGIELKISPKVEPKTTGPEATPEASAAEKFDPKASQVLHLEIDPSTQTKLLCLKNSLCVIKIEDGDLKLATIAVTLKTDPKIESSKNLAPVVIPNQTLFNTSLKSLEKIKLENGDTLSLLGVIQTTYGLVPEQKNIKSCAQSMDSFINNSELIDLSQVHQTNIVGEKIFRLFLPTNLNNGQGADGVRNIVCQYTLQNAKLKLGLSDDDLRSGQGGIINLVVPNPSLVVKDEKDQPEIDPETNGQYNFTTKNPPEITDVVLNLEKTARGEKIQCSSAKLCKAYLIEHKPILVNLSQKK